tara:strand:+ start:6638 stop:7774 length:1137 start_codon:yes stop_codon:yes gene_type:complete
MKINSNTMQLDKSLPTIDDLKELLLNNINLLDVRAPIEFSDGALPTAKNIPILNDKERSEVGKIYKNEGHEAALAHGLKIIKGQKRERKIKEWKSFLTKNNEGAIYCYRGGLRSQITQQWLKETTGKVFPRVSGGYKSIRNFLIENLDINSINVKPIIIGGRTGVGKTLFIKSINPNIDLEDLAFHRGSAFGSHSMPQPTQVDFENRLSLAILKTVSQKKNFCLVEDESSNIGKRHIPKSFFNVMNKSPILVLQATTEERIKITKDEYVKNSLQEYQDMLGEGAGFDMWSKGLKDSLLKVRKRLGGVNYKIVEDLLIKAIDLHSKNGETYLHEKWIKELLLKYYDAMYKYQLEKKKERIILKGTKKDLQLFLKENYMD